jgi:hypothetical protein
MKGPGVFEMLKGAIPYIDFEEFFSFGRVKRDA